MNISNICYDFIDNNVNLFDLKQYDQNHSMNFELLDNFVSNQTCSNKYFELLKYIYKQSTYIDCDAFIQTYTSNIKDINDRFSDKEIILLFPYLDLKKSNYFFTFYFIYLYNTILSKKINYIFPYKRNDKTTNVIDINTLSLSKEPLFVVCDDFLYSGGQLSLTIANLPIVCSNITTVNIYACIVGMTKLATNNFTKEKLLELGNKGYDNEENQSLISYNAIFSQNVVVIEKNLRSVIRQKIIDDGFKGIVLVKHLYDYIKDNDMYILEVQNNKLYAVGQFADLYYNLNNTLIYLFFKYPDLISTVLSMCVLNIYSNSYTVSLDMLPNKPGIIINYPREFKKTINKFEITNELFNDNQNLEEIKQQLTLNKPIDINKFNWIQKCSDYDFSSNNVKLVNVDNNKRIELIRNIKNDFNSLNGSLCNDSITTFYKDINLINIFEAFSKLIEKTSVGGRKMFYKRKRTMKRKKTMKKKKTMKRKRTMKRK